jgi:adenine-specific DNA-methyltransferase
MNKDLKNIINQFSDDENTLNKILVSIFINSNSLKVKNNELIKGLILSKESPLYHHIVFATYKFSFDELIESFELAIPSQDKVVNGAVYTPNYIKSFIVEIGRYFLWLRSFSFYNRKQTEERNTKTL